MTTKPTTIVKNLVPWLTIGTILLGGAAGFIELKTKNMVNSIDANSKAIEKKVEREWVEINLKNIEKSISELKSDIKEQNKELRDDIKLILKELR